MAESNNGGNNAAGATIQLDTMSLEQLDQLKQREENRLQACTQRFAALRQAAARLSASASAVTELYDKVDDKGKDKEKLPQNEETPVSEDATVDTGGCKEVFVPLTESVYIPGKIQTSDTALLVELGTGYFVERNPSQTVEFLQRKMTVVNANSENVTQMIQATRQNLESIAMAMKGKLVEIQARQQGQRHRAALSDEGK